MNCACDPPTGPLAEDQADQELKSASAAITFLVKGLTALHSRDCQIRRLEYGQSEHFDEPLHEHPFVSWLFISCADQLIF